MPAAYGRGIGYTSAPIRDGRMPTGAIAETFSRAGAPVGNAAVLSSGRMSLVAINLDAGQLITSISFLSATTALSGGTAQWFALYSSSLALLRQSTDDTSTAWAGNTVKTLNLTSTYTTTTSGLYYLGINVTASTVPTLFCNTSSGNITTLAPKINGTSDTGLSGTAPNPAAAITAASFYPYGYVS